MGAQNSTPELQRTPSYMLATNSSKSKVFSTPPANRSSRNEVRCHDCSGVCSSPVLCAPIDAKWRLLLCRFRAVKQSLQSYANCKASPLRMRHRSALVHC